MPEPKKDFRSSHASSWKAVADGQELLVNGFLWPSASTPPTLHVQVGVDLMVPTNKKTSSNNSLTRFEWARYIFQVFGICGFPSAWDSGAHHLNALLQAISMPTKTDWSLPENWANGSPRMTLRRSWAFAISHGFVLAPFGIIWNQRLG